MSLDEKIKNDLRNEIADLEASLQSTTELLRQRIKENARLREELQFQDGVKKGLYESRAELLEERDRLRAALRDCRDDHCRPGPEIDELLGEGLEKK